MEYALKKSTQILQNFNALWQTSFMWHFFFGGNHKWNLLLGALHK